MRMDDFLERGSKLFPDKPVMSFQGGSRTYGELQGRVARLAHGLKVRATLKPGDRIAVLSRNCPEFVEVYLACSVLGCVVVPLNYRLHPDDYLFLIGDSEAKVLFVEEDFAQRLEGPLKELGSKVDTWFIGSEGSKWPRYEDLLDEDPLVEPEGPSDEDVWIQMYTSGTTGFPKGVLLTHRNVVSTALGLALDVPFNVDPCKVLVVAPIFHIGGLITIFASMVCGKAFHLEREFHPHNVLKAMSEGGCTHAFMVPVMVRALLGVGGLDKLDFSRFRVLMYGAAPMPEGLAKRAKEVFGCQLIQGYGLTESTGVLGLLMDLDHEVCPGATCREYSMARIKVVDPRGMPVGPGEVGEIVAEVAVIGVPDEKWGEEVMAIIVPKAGSGLTADEIRQFCRVKLAPMKRPRKVLLRDSLPMTPTGKIDKKELREEFWKGMEKRVH